MAESLEVHHIIPKNVWNDEDLNKELTKLAADTGFHLELESDLNKVALPKSKIVADAAMDAVEAGDTDLRHASIGSVQHNGSHTAYSDFVRNEISDIFHSGDSPEEKLKQIQGFHSFLKDGLAPQSSGGDSTTTSGDGKELKLFLVAAGQDGSAWEQYARENDKLPANFDALAPSTQDAKLRDALHEHYDGLSTQYRSSQAYKDGYTGKATNGSLGDPNADSTIISDKDYKDRLPKIALNADGGLTLFDHSGTKKDLKGSAKAMAAYFGGVEFAITAQAKAAGTSRKQAADDLGIGLTSDDLLQLGVGLARDAAIATIPVVGPAYLVIEALIEAPAAYGALRQLFHYLEAKAPDGTWLKDFYTGVNSTIDDAEAKINELKDAVVGGFEEAVETVRAALEIDLRAEAEDLYYSLHGFLEQLRDYTFEDAVNDIADGAEYAYTALGEFLGAKCFAPSTPILMADGTYKPIIDVAVGDFVLSFPQASLGRGELEPKRVTRTFRNTTEEWVALTADNEKQTSAYVTPGHRFLTETGAFETIGSMLRLGGGSCKVVGDDGNVAVVRGNAIRYSQQTAEQFDQTFSASSNGNLALQPSVNGWLTCNFEVEDNHTYVAAGLRVHNDSVKDHLPGDAVLIATSLDDSGTPRDMLFLNSTGHLVFLDGANVNDDGTGIIRQLESNDPLSFEQVRNLRKEIAEARYAERDVPLVDYIDNLTDSRPKVIPVVDSQTISVDYGDVEAYEIFDNELSGLGDAAPEARFSAVPTLGVLDYQPWVSQSLDVTYKADGQGTPAYMVDWKVLETDRFLSTDHTLNHSKSNALDAYGQRTNQVNFFNDFTSEPYTIATIYGYRPHSYVLEQSVLFHFEVVVSDSASDDDDNPDLFIDHTAFTVSETSSGGWKISVDAKLANADPDDVLPYIPGGAELVLYLTLANGSSFEVARRPLNEFIGGEIKDVTFYGLLQSSFEENAATAHLAIELSEGLVNDSPERLIGVPQLLSFPHRDDPDVSDDDEASDASEVEELPAGDASEPDVPTVSVDLLAIDSIHARASTVGDVTGDFTIEIVADGALTGGTAISTGQYSVSGGQNFAINIIDADTVQWQLRGEGLKAGGMVDVVFREEMANTIDFQISNGQAYLFVNEELVDRRNVNGEINLNDLGGWNIGARELYWSGPDGALRDHLKGANVVEARYTSVAMIELPEPDPTIDLLAIESSAERAAALGDLSGAGTLQFVINDPIGGTIASFGEWSVSGGDIFAVNVLNGGSQIHWQMRADGEKLGDVIDFNVDDGAENELAFQFWDDTIEFYADGILTETYDLPDGYDGITNDAVTIGARTKLWQGPTAPLVDELKGGNVIEAQWHSDQFIYDLG